MQEESKRFDERVRRLKEENKRLREGSKWAVKSGMGGNVVGG